MGLQVWLPLTKDLHNQGLNQVSFTNAGATYGATTGKLGGAYSFDGTDDRIYANNISLNNSAMSACCWVKLNNFTSSSYPYIFALGSNTSGTGIQIGLSVWQSDSKIHLVGNGSEPSSGYTPPLNTWIHLCITIQGAITKLYVNGELTNTQTNANSPKTQTCLCLGARSNSTSGAGSAFSYPMSGYINDFRLYDNCLSEKEIKEIAKGLFLHYPFNRRGLGNENLLANTDVEKTGSSATAQWFRWNVVNPMLETSTTYTLSFDAKITVTTDVFYISWSNADSTQEIINQGTQVTTEYKRYSFTGQTTKTNINAILISNYKGYNRGNNNNTTGVLSVRNIKLELGDKATPYSPNSTDTLYSSMNLGAAIEYDYSGFGNNGTHYNAFNYSLDTPKYGMSIEYNGTNNTIVIPFNANIWPDNFTMNIWFKKDAIGSKGYETLFGGPSGFEMDTRSGTSTSLALYMASTRGGTLYSGFQFGQWYMVTLVNDGTNELYYVNGELVNTIEKKAMPVGTYYIGSWAGTEKQNYQGLISDARIYATALSATDVLSLYQNNAYIDQSGQIYGPVR